MHNSDCEDLHTSHSNLLNLVFPTYTITDNTVDVNNLVTDGIYIIKAFPLSNLPTSNHGVLLVFGSVGTPFQVWIADNRACVYKRHGTVANGVLTSTTGWYKSTDFTAV